MSGTPRVALRATGRSLPDRVVPNVEFVGTLDTSDEWIRTRTGIRERRFSGPQDTAASLALTASKRALASAKLTAHDLDLIICSTVTPDWMTPAVSNMLQHGLGCRMIPSFDILAACTGFLYAMSIGEQYIRSGTARNVLIVGTEVLSRVIDMTDRNSCILFGDGAGAAILSATDDPAHGVHSIRLFSDGSKSSFITVPSFATQVPAGQPPTPYIKMHGREVFKFAVTRMIELIEEARTECERIGRRIDWLIPHQVNQRIIDSALDSTGLPADRVVVNLDHYGNTSAASIPIALDEAQESGRVKAGDTVLFVAFGGGLTWASALVTL